MRFLRHNLSLVAVFFCALLWSFQWWLHSDLTRQGEVLNQREIRVINLENQVIRSAQREIELKDLLNRLDNLDLGPRDQNSFEMQVSVLADQWGLAKPSTTSWPLAPSDHVVVTRQGDFVDTCHWLHEISIQCPVGSLRTLEIFEVVEDPGAVLCRVAFDHRNFGDVR